MGWSSRNIWRSNNSTNTDCVLWEVRCEVEGTSDNIQITLEHNRIFNLLNVIESSQDWLRYKGKFRDNNRAKAPEVLRPMYSFSFPLISFSNFFILLFSTIPVKSQFQTYFFDMYNHMPDLYRVQQTKFFCGCWATLLPAPDATAVTFLIKHDSVFQLPRWWELSAREEKDHILY